MSSRWWLLAWLACAASAHAATVRIAVVVGSNAGSDERPPLRYAESDAGKFARLLVELGDVRAENLFLLQGRALGVLESTLQEAGERVARLKARPDTRVLLIFYFSGHSDGEALELGTERLPYAQLKAWMQGTGADVRVGVMDACKSGRAITQRGAVAGPAFSVALSDELVSRGEVFITSAAANEAALESSEIRGGFFTHNLTSGLRGAADVSGDGQVTLAEAYRYAYDRTVFATLATNEGAQHPVYDYRLSGQGELVLTTLVPRSAKLVMPEGATRALVTDVLRDQVVVELTAAGQRTVAVQPGDYGVVVVKAGVAYSGRLSVAEAQTRALQWSELEARTHVVRASVRGGDAKGVEAAPTRAASGQRSLLFLGISGGPTITPGAGTASGVRLTYERGSRQAWTASLAGGTSLGLERPVRESVVKARLGHRWLFPLGRWAFGAGAELGSAVYFQRFAGQATASSWALSAAPRVMTRVRMTSSLHAQLEGELEGALLRLDERLQLLPVPSVALSIGMVLP